MTMFQRHQISIAGWIVIALAVVSFVQVLWVTYDTRQTNECQAQINAEVTKTVIQRAALADSDRDAVRDLVTTLFTNTEGTEEERQAIALEAYTTYTKRNQKLDDIRATLTFPTDTTC